MKRIAVCVLCLLLLVSCRVAETQEEKEHENARYVSGVWLSFSELDGMVRSENPREQLERFAADCAMLSITDAFIHTVAFCDAIYSSEYYPLRAGYDTLDFDVMQYLVELLHKKGIRLHAWINPYRVKTADGYTSTLPQGCPAKKWLNDDSTENDRAVCVYGGVYLNPAEACVRELVISGIKEIISKYDIDGVHFDDYFYPTADPEFDAPSYEAYSGASKIPIALGDWRRENVNLLLSGCHAAVDYYGRDLTFSVSPAASIDKNRDELYADVGAWVEGGYVDMLLPQLYFGFDYPLEDYRFEALLADWEELLSGSEIQLIVGLASYKVGTDVEPDCDEWSDTAVISRQIRVCMTDPAVAGWCFFSYSSLFGEGVLQGEALQRIKAIQSSHF